MLLEALTLKKFIISSKCPTGPQEILLNGKGGLLFNVGNHNQLASKIIYYEENKKKCLSMLRQAIKKMYRFDYQINLKKYLNLVNQIS